MFCFTLLDNGLFSLDMHTAQSNSWVRSSCDLPDDFTDVTALNETPSAQNVLFVSLFSHCCHTPSALPVFAF